MEQQTQEYRALITGTVLNRQYSVESVIGKGGFGITYLASDNFLKMTVAIKEFFPSQIVNRDITNTNTVSVSEPKYLGIYKKGLEEYEFEANKLTKFSGLDGVVSVLNFFYENNTAYMVMEYIEGVTLKEYLKSHDDRVSWKEMLVLMNPVFKSMNIVHKEGIVHRDISPDNIMISPKKKLTIIDFGSAKSKSENIGDTIILKHGYAPPEQYQRAGSFGAWTDVYALCATMYRMLTGEKPPKSIDLLDKKTRITPIRQYDASIPKDVEKAILKGLMPEIEDRTKSVLELKRQLYSDVRAKSAINLKKKSARNVLMVIVSISLIISFLYFLNSQNKKMESEQEMTEKDMQDGLKNGDYLPTEASEFTELVDKNKEKIPEKYENLSEIPIDTITYEIFDDSISISKIDASVTDGRIPSIIEGKSVKNIKGMGSNITNIMLPEGVESIEESAFKNCVYLENIYIPSTVKKIDTRAFVNCPSIKEVELSKNNSNFYLRNNTLYSSDGEMILKW